MQTLLESKMILTVPVRSQKLERPHRDVQEFFQRGRDVRRPPYVDDATVGKPRRRVLLQIGSIAELVGFEAMLFCKTLRNLASGNSKPN